MKIGILGDTHMQTNWTLFALWKFNKEGITKVIQVGDFGIAQTMAGARFLDAVNAAAAQYGIELYVVPGNHEDWVWINRLTENDRQTWANLCPNIYLAPRGIRWEWDGVTFVALGGAPSVDRTWRLEDQEFIKDPKQHIWFPDEMITWEDVEYVAAGGHADVMIGHDAPENVPTIEARIGRNPFGWNPADLLYAADGRRRYTEAFKAVAPDTLFHGHYHFKVDDMVRTFEDNWCNVIGLGCDGMKEGLGHYDTETRKGHIWDVGRDMGEYNALVRK
jgi:hypothetical protein